MCCAARQRRKVPNNPYRPIYKLHWREIPNWTLREESLCVGKCQEDTNDQAGGQACPNLQGQSTALLHSTACFQDSIDKKPNLGLEVYFNKANEGTDMLEPGHTIASLRKHFGYSSHYEVQLTLEHGLTSDCPRTPLTSITWRSYTTPLKTQHIRHKGPNVKNKQKKKPKELRHIYPSHRSLC